MGTTPIYGFPYPDPSDLVANYPALGQELAEDIEAVLPTLGGLAVVAPTSIANSGGTATLTNGVVTFSGVTSVSLNGVFTSSFRHYRLLLHDGSASAIVNLLTRMRAAGADNSAGNYAYGGRLMQYATTAGNADLNAATATSNLVCGIGTARKTNMSMDILNPQTSLETSYSALAAGTDRSDMSAGSMTVTTSYDGITFLGSSGTISGNIRVYGYRN